jgi:hypothetical protein
MDEFIAETAKHTGLGIDRCRVFVGRLLVLAEAAVGSDRLHLFIDRVPGARAVIAAAGGGHDLAELGTVVAASVGPIGPQAGVTQVAGEAGVSEAQAVDVAESLIRFFGRSAGPVAEQTVREGLFPPAIEDEEDGDDDQ